MLTCHTWTCPQGTRFYRSQASASDAQHSLRSRYRRNDAIHFLPSARGAAVFYTGENGRVAVPTFALRRCTSFWLLTAENLLRLCVCLDDYFGKTPVVRLHGATLNRAATLKLFFRIFCAGNCLKDGRYIERATADCVSVGGQVEPVAELLECPHARFVPMIRDATSNTFESGVATKSLFSKQVGIEEVDTDMYLGRAFVLILRYLGFDGIKIPNGTWHRPSCHADDLMHEEYAVCQAQALLTREPDTSVLVTDEVREAVLRSVAS